MERTLILIKPDAVERRLNGVIIDRLEKAGFAVRVDEYVKTLTPDTIDHYGLITEDNLYICTKYMY